MTATALFCQIILKQKWFYLNTRNKSLKIKEINQENPESRFNLGIKMKHDLFYSES
jgi:hypothetical protein